MPDDKWSDDAWDDESDESPEPDLYTLHSDEVDPVTGQPETPDADAGDAGAGPRDEDVIAASEPLDPPAPSPSIDSDVDELSMGNPVTVTSDNGGSPPHTHGVTFTP